MKQRLANKILCTYTFETRIQPDGSYEVSFIIYDKPGYGPKPIKYASLKKVLKKLGKMCEFKGNAMYIWRNWA